METYLNHKKHIKIIVEDADGKQATLTLTSEEINELSKSFLYQTSTNVIGFKTRQLIHDFVMCDLHGGIFDLARSVDLNKLHISEFSNISEEYNHDTWKKTGKWKITIKNNVFVYDNKKLAVDELDLAKELSRKIFNKK